MNLLRITALLAGGTFRSLKRNIETCLRDTPERTAARLESGAQAPPLAALALVVSLVIRNYRTVLGAVLESVGASHLEEKVSEAVNNLLKEV